MSVKLNLATWGFPQATRFILVNDRMPLNEEHCALCGGTIEKGYVRDFKIGLIYCDTQCFAGGAYNFTKDHVRIAS